VATNAGVYTLRADPPQLSLQDAPDPPRPGPAPADGSALVVDREEGLIWVLATGTDSGAAWAYDSRTLEWRISVPIPSRVTGAAALGGQLWVASDAGVYLTSAPRPDVDTPVRVPGSLSGTYGIAADPTRGRVVAVTGGWPGQVYAIGAHDLVVRRLARVPTGKSSIAVVDGHVWVGGYGYGRRLIPIGVPSRVPLPVEYRVGAGAAVWPGRHVLWVTYGTGAGLSCLDPRTGAELASWPELIAPVTSRDGLVYAAAATDVTIQVLPKACPG
jgi:hypothetical protein